MDGTLIDSCSAWSDSILEVFARHGIRHTEQDWEIFMTVPTIEGAQYLEKTYGLDVTPEELTEEINSEVRRRYEEMVPLKPGADDLVKLTAEEGLKIYMASSTDRSEIVMLMDKFGLAQYFDEYYPVAEYNTSKAEPEIFNIILEAAGASASETLLIEDAYYSMKTGKDMGMHIAAVKDDFEVGMEEVIAEIADIYVDEPADFLV